MNTVQLKPGDNLPPLSKGPITRQMLVEWCAAENDYYTLHYDDRVAEQMKLPGTPIQGTFKYALMGQMIEGWLKGRGILRKISASYRGLSLEGDTLTSGGRISEVHDEPNGQVVTLDVWVEGPQGDRSTSGQAVVFFPLKTSA